MVDGTVVVVVVVVVVLDVVVVLVPDSAVVVDADGGDVVDGAAVETLTSLVDWDTTGLAARSSLLRTNPIARTLAASAIAMKPIHPRPRGPFTTSAVSVDPLYGMP